MWSQNEIEKCVEMANEGKSYLEIGNVIGKTGHAVKCKFLKSNIKIVRRFKKHEVVKCLNCGKDIEGGDRKFCNNSCSAIYNNKSRKKENFCIECGELTERKYKYCSNKCQNEHQYKEYIKKWKDGEVEGKRGEYNISKHIKRYLFDKYNNKCTKCGWSEINQSTGKIPLEIDHIDGNGENNKEENLTLLCPNCHSLTSTYKGLNRGNGRYKRKIKYRKMAS